MYLYVFIDGKESEKLTTEAHLSSAAWNSLRLLALQLLSSSTATPSKSELSKQIIQLLYTELKAIVPLFENMRVGKNKGPAGVVEKQSQYMSR